MRSVTLSGVAPLHGAGASRFIRVEGFEEAADAHRHVLLNWVGPRYFETFGTPLVAGRDFAFTDKGGPPVAIVNQLPLALLSRRAASRVVTDLPADSVWPLVLATTAMLAIALVAAYVPARRAARVEPIEALRQ